MILVAYGAVVAGLQLWHKQSRIRHPLALVAWWVGMATVVFLLVLLWSPSLREFCDQTVKRAAIRNPAAQDEGISASGVQPSPPWHSALEDKLAPDFALPTLTGGTCRISSERGHVILIDFWDTDCPPCVAELKLVISQLADDASLHKKGLRVWTVDAMDDTDTIRKFIAANHYHFTVVSNAGGAVTNRYPIGGIPTTYLIDRDGVVRNVLDGFGPTTDHELRSDIDAALH
jgi:peroxiredoxin